MDRDAEPTNKADVDGHIDVRDLIAQFMNGQGEGEASNLEFATNSLSGLQAARDEECPICFEPMDPPMIVPSCMHNTFVHLIQQKYLY